MTSRSEDLSAAGDAMQSALSRLAAFAAVARNAEGRRPSEVSMAIVEAKSAVDAWTALRRQDAIGTRTGRFSCAAPPVARPRVCSDHGRDGRVMCPECSRYHREVAALGPSLDTGALHGPIIGYPEGDAGYAYLNGWASRQECPHRPALTEIRHTEDR